MTPCPYRRTHEYDAEGLCAHCYTPAPKDDRWGIDPQRLQELQAQIDEAFKRMGRQFGQSAPDDIPTTANPTDQNP